MKNKIKYLLVAVLITLSVVISANVFATDNSGKITLTKTATKDYTGAADNNVVYGRTAQVNLNVSATPYTSQETTYDQVDIVLVLDGSGSMAYDVNGYQEGARECTDGGPGQKPTCTSLFDSSNVRLNLAKSSATSFVNSMMKEGSSNVQIGLVEYGTNVKDVQNLTSSKSTVQTFITDKWDANGGTNLQAGIAKAEDLLSTDTRDNVKKIVIVLTDGIPTFFNYNNSPKGTGSTDDSVCIKKECNFRDECYCVQTMSPSDAARDEMNSLKSTYTNADVYTIRFGNESAADTKLAKINSTSNSNDTHKYENLTAIDGEALSNTFKHIEKNTVNAVASNTVVTDVIPVGFELTSESITALETAGVTITNNEDGTTTLTWTIGALSATQAGGYNLSYIIQAKDAYHGSMYTNSSAVLTATVDDNPYYKDETSVRLTAENPSVEIPAITSNDSYLQDSSYVTYETVSINGTTVKANDTLTYTLNEYGTSTDSLVVVTNDNVVKDGSTYKIYKDSKLQGTLVMNENGTFTYTAEPGITGTVEFQYYIQTNFSKSKETSYVRSNTATVTLNVLPRSVKDITINKTWDDNNDQDGKRPTSLLVTLTGNDGTVKTATMTGSSNTWTTTITGLYVYAEGHEGEENYLISYDVTEETVSDYELTKEDGYNLTNKHTPETTTYTVTKIWNDANNQDGKRPTSITVTLTGTDGTSETANMTGEGNNWTYTFENLTKYSNGSLITYSVSESEVAGYTTTQNGSTITNSYTPETTTIQGSKTWVDDENRDGLRPESISVSLKANGVVVATLTATEARNWAYNFGERPVYSNGEKIKYTVEETPIANYKTTYDGYNVTNTHESEKTTYTVKKVWNDNNNQDNKRASYSIQLTGKVGDKTVYTSDVVTLSATDLEYTFNDLYKYSNGTEITYSVDEVTVPTGYTKSIKGNTITNTHKPEQTSISVSKVWDDDDDRDGLRSNSVSVTLAKDGVATDTKVTLSEDNNWTYTFTNLDKYENKGQLVKYTVSEDTVSGYETTITGNATSGYTITNKHEVSLTSINVNKTWNDNNDQDGIRPESVTIKLLADGEETGKTVTLSKSNNWESTFTNLYENKEGSKVNYTVEEESVNAYKTEYSRKDNTITVTNTHTPETKEITITKVWDDDSNRDGIRPESVTIELYANNKYLKDITLTNNTTTNSNTWSSTVSVDKYSNHGTEITYTIKEKNTPSGYGTPTYEGLTVTNHYVVEKTNINVTKVWEDSNDQDGLRPDSITVELLTYGAETGTTLTLSADNNWSGTFTNLIKNKSKDTPIEYTIRELSESEYYSTDITGNMTDGFTVTNTHKTYTTTVSGTKTWNDANDQDGQRPTSITVNVMDGTTKVASKVVTAEDNWSYEFKNLPLNKNGEQITYTVSEEAVAGYTKSNDGYNLINTYSPEKTSITVTKVWNDKNDQDGVRPESVTVTLVKNGVATNTSEVLSEENNWTYTFENLNKYENKGQLINYTVSENEVSNYETSITGNATSGYTITNTHTPEKTTITLKKVWNDDNNRDLSRPESLEIIINANGKLKEKIVLTESDETVDGNTWSFTETVDKYYNHGEEIVYTAYEKKVPFGYSKSESGLTVTNTYHIATTTISGTKTWNDDNDRDKIRPNSITIRLMNGNTIVATTTASASTNWTYSFENVPVNENGQQINYTVVEDAVEGYATTYDGYNIINTYSPETTTYTVNKIWDDNDNQDGMRASYTIQLTGTVNGEEVYKSSTVTLGSARTQYTFENLYKKYEGQNIVYSVDEINVPTGYTKSINGNTITNTHTPETYDLVGKKTWIDANDQDGIRPDSIDIKLTATVDGKEIESLSQTATIKSDNTNDWEYKFADLPKYNEGSLVTYTVTEVSEVAGYEISYDKDNKNIIVNTHETSKTSVKVNKTWDDNNNQDGYRPESVVIRLVANGEDTNKTITLNENNNWAGEFTDLDEYSKGSKITYSVKEEMDEVSDQQYDTEYKEKDNIITVINTHTPEVVSYEVTKTWDDEDNNDGIRPESIEVVLYKNGKSTSNKATLSADEEGTWTYTFENLDKYEDGKEIEYSVAEIDVDGYESTIEGNVITNKHATAKVSYEVTKTWEDNDDQDGVRPESITVTLYKNDEVFDTKTISSDNNWTYTFENLYKYEKGELVKYTIVESEVKGYTTEITESEITEDNIIKVGITNTHTPETTDINIQKIWDDSDNKYYTRPEDITVNIYANGDLQDTITIDSSTNWTKSITVDKYKNKEEVTYSITEESVNGYEASYDGYTITNTYVLGQGGEEYPIVQTGEEVNTKAISASLIFVSAIALSIVRRKRFN